MTESSVSMKAQIIGVAVILLVIAGIGFAIVQSGVFDNPTVYVRNETGKEAYVGIVGSDNGAWGDMSLVVAPWHEGMCPVGRISFGAGHKPTGAAFLDGPRSWMMVSEPMSFPHDGPYYVRIDAQGVMHVGEPLPEPPKDCTGYLVGYP